ncbi:MULTISPECIES: cupin domain-containing protein [unclassified Bradyrhizobium]
MLQKRFDRQPALGGRPHQRASTIHYCVRGVGVILLDGETLTRLTLHTLVIVPPGRAMTIAPTEDPTAPRNAGKHGEGASAPGSSHQHTVGDGEPTLVLACGIFRTNYGPARDLFASLATSVVETFDVHDQLDQVIAYAMAELAAQDVGGGPVSAGLLKLVLLALLRRCLVSTKRFSILSAPRSRGLLLRWPLARHHCTPFKACRTPLVSAAQLLWCASPPHSEGRPCHCCAA